ncbi:histone-lysine N-methyltransferase, H3 lysine-79 specific, partial [Rhodotorula sp. JG-1b]
AQRIRFALLAPRSDDEYNPIEDVMSVPPSPSLPPPAAATTATAPPAESLIRQLEKARSKSDGPGFLAALARYNSTLVSLKRSGILRRNIQEMKGLREKVWTRVFTQCYDRAVGPGLEDVRKYRAFSDNVYGELLPKFMNEIFARTHLGPKGVFVDLGSGVGNCVVQAALATGAESWGFENMPHASQLARAQVVEAEARFELWGLAGGAMHVREANFCESPEVGEVLRRADVVLVNNEVFTSSLNERLSWLFLELPPSAKIVSLKPFLPPSFKLSSHNVHSPLAILSQYPPLRYTSNCVSWKPEGGTYFLARIDRGRVERF